MPATVIDASALGAIVFNEPEAQAVTERLGESSLYAPALIWFELASICLKKVKQRPEQEEQLVAALRRAADMQIELAEVDHGDVVTLARSTKLSTYDASYLWMARHIEEAELVTLDQALDSAWREGQQSAEAATS